MILGSHDIYGSPIEEITHEQSISLGLQRRHKRSLVHRVGEASRMQLHQRVVCSELRNRGYARDPIAEGPNLSHQPHRAWQKSVLESERVILKHPILGGLLSDRKRLILFRRLRRLTSNKRGRLCPLQRRSNVMARELRACPLSAASHPGLLFLLKPARTGA